MQVLTTVDLDQLRDLRARGEFFWLDLDDPDRDTVDAVGRLLGLHELALEDTQEFDQRPKVDSYADQILVVYFGARLDSDAGPVPVEVHLHISATFVLTVHRDRCRQFEVVQHVLGSEPPASGTAVVYRVIDALTDAVLDVVEQVADEVDEFEAQVFRRPRAKDRDRMAVIRRSLGGLRRVLATQRTVLHRVVEHIVALPGLEADASAYYRDVEDHLSRAVDEVEAARDGLQGILDTYTNEVQERLTIVATIFLPLTVITSFFGQNFSWLVNHIGSTWAFWGLGVGGLVVSSLGISWWLRRSGLYQGRR